MDAQTIPINGKELLLAKVGFSKSRKYDRAETVRKRVRKEMIHNYDLSDNFQPCSEVPLKFMFDASETQKNCEVEKSIRKRIGFPLNKDKAKSLGLPIHTEWVLTTPEHIDKVMSTIEDCRRNGKVISTNMFKYYKDFDLGRVLNLDSIKLHSEVEQIKFSWEWRLHSRSKTLSPRTKRTRISNVGLPQAGAEEWNKRPLRQKY